MNGARQPGVSVVVVVSERPINLRGLYDAYSRALQEAGWVYEFIFVIEGGLVGISKPLLELRASGEPVRVVEVAQPVGEAMLLRLGAARAQADVILSIPAYWRVDPDSVPRLLATVDEGADMAVACRWPREDSWVNRLQNRAFHKMVRRVSGSELKDLACGVRAFRTIVLDEVPLYGDFYRFFPLLAHRVGFRVAEVPLPQHPEDVTPRVYPPGIYLRRLLDLLGMFFLLRFTNKPLRFFGIVGSGLSFAGFVVLLVLAVQRIEGQGLADRPMLLLGVLFLALGVQAIALGLIGEIIVFLSSPEHPPYRIAREPEPDTLEDSDFVTGATEDGASVTGSPTSTRS
jgi:hypothetical protein